MSRQGSNSIQIRHYNERVVLEAIRKLGQASKAEIARRANLTPQAVAGIVDALTEAGYIAQIGKRHGQIGQPSVLYAPNPERAFSIGLHVGRRAFDSVLVNFAGETLHRITHEYAYPEPDKIAGLALADVQLLTARLAVHLRDRVVGIGVSIPYFLSGWQNDLGFPDHVVAAWASFNLPQYLIEHTKFEIYFENDASAAATAELVYGQGATERNFIYLYINTLIGGGLVLNGNIETGPHGNTAAFNTFPVSRSQLSTVVPPKGDFELLQNRASIFVLIRHLKANGVAINRVSELTVLGANAEPFLREWQEDCVGALAQAIIGAVSVVDTDVIIVDSILPPPILQQTVDMLAERLAALAPEGFITPAIRAGSIGVGAAAIGAAILPLYAIFAPNNDVLAKRYKAPSNLLLAGASK
jgi:predicted NBD/HSP70 family sugar kinase